MREPGVILRRQPKACFRQTSEGASDKQAIDHVAVAVGWHPVARKGQEHDQHGEALLPVEHNGMA